MQLVKEMSNLVPLLVVSPLAVAFLLPLVSRRSVRGAEVLTNVTFFGLFVAAFSLQGHEIIYHMGAWPTPTGIDLRVDGLTTLMLLTINGLALVVSLYSISSIARVASSYRYYSLMLFMVAGLNGVVVTGDLFNLYVFMEITAIASYALVAYDGKHEELEASFKYAVLGGLASSAILLGIGVTYAVTGTVNMTQLAERFSEIGTVGPLRFALALFLAGFGLKAALVPFHAWLPDAYPAAPTPISAILSGIVSKAIGLYVLARLLFNVFGVTDDILMIMRWMGGMTMVVGGIMALGQSDIKRLFAYSSMSQVGLMLLAFGFGTTWGMVGALFHLINHAAFEPLLFLNSGQVERAANTRDLRQMKGLRRVIPVTAATSMVASLSLAGIPPFNGFWSKLIIVVAGIDSGQTVWGVLVVVMSIVSLAYQLRVQKAAFYSSDESSRESAQANPIAQQEREPVFAVVPMILLALGCVALSLLVTSGLERPILVWPAAEVLLRGLFAS